MRRALRHRAGAAGARHAAVAGAQVPQGQGREGGGAGGGVGGGAGGKEGGEAGVAAAAQVLRRAVFMGFIMLYTEKYIDRWFKHV